MRPLSFACSLLLLLIVTFLLPLTSVAVNYTNVSGSTVGFTGINDASGLWEQPAAAGDTLVFTPSNYIAACPADPNCIAGGGFVSVDDNLEFTIEANPGGSLGILLFEESGTATLTSSGGFAFANVGSIITVISIEALDGTTINPITTGGPNLSFTPGTDFNSPGVFLFSGTATLDLDAIIALADPLETRRATRVRISLNNPLGAFAEVNATSLIQKDEFRITVVPEPGTTLLFGLGLLGLAVRRTRGGNY